MPQREAEPALPGPAQSPLRTWAGLYSLFFVAALLVYSVSLSGPFISDDLLYITHNVFVRDFTVANLREILDPQGAPTTYTANYAPLHLLSHALEWRVFGMEVGGYHLVNVALYALSAVLLCAWYRDSGLRQLPAFVGAVLFLLHPGPSSRPCAPGSTSG